MSDGGAWLVDGQEINFACASSSHLRAERRSPVSAGLFHEDSRPASAMQASSSVLRLTGVFLMHHVFNESASTG